MLGDVTVQAESGRTKDCAKCSLPKILDDFGIDRRHSDGRQSQCRTCTNERSSNWAKANRPRVNSRERARYKLQPEQFAKRTRKWSEANPDSVARTKRLFLDSHPDYQATYRKVNERAILDAYLRRRYKITIDTYEEALSDQGGRCAICRSEVPGGKGRFHVDHCHLTGTFRGLLCHRCNVHLGGFRDDPVLLRSAADYLEKVR